MTEPILTRDQILKIVEPFADEAMMQNHQDEIMRCIAELEAAVLEKVCGEPVDTAFAMPGKDGYTMAVFRADDVPVGTKIYALARSKP